MAPIYKLGTLWGTLTLCNLLNPVLSNMICIYLFAILYSKHTKLPSEERIATASARERRANHKLQSGAVQRQPHR